MDDNRYVSVSQPGAEDLSYGYGNRDGFACWQVYSTKRIYELVAMRYSLPMEPGWKPGRIQFNTYRQQAGVFADIGINIQVFRKRNITPSHWAEISVVGLLNCLRRPRNSVRGQRVFLFCVTLWHTLSDSEQCFVIVRNRNDIVYTFVGLISNNPCTEERNMTESCPGIYQHQRCVINKPIAKRWDFLSISFSPNGAK